MTTYIIVSFIFLALSTAFAFKAEKITGLELNTKLLMVVLLISAFVFRLILGYTSTSYDTDMALFKAWGNSMSEDGPANVYNTGLYLDYPPGYLYVLWLLDGIRRLFSLDYGGAMYSLVMKLPPILADLGCGYMIYRTAKKIRPGHESTAFTAAAAFLFCPAVLINSTVWGQVDSWCTLILLISVWLLSEAESDGKLIASAALYGLAVISKPQMLIFAPIYLFATIFRKNFKGLFIGIGTALLVILAVSKPFTDGFDFTWLIDKYRSTMDYYSYYSINAYNLWDLFGLNWHSLPESGFGLFVLNWFGPAFAAALCGLVMFFGKEKYRKGSLIVSAAVLMFTVFIFSVKMHERYVFPALIFMLLTYFYTGSRNYLMHFASLSFAHFLNVAYVLYLNNTYVSPTSWPLILLSALHVVIYIAFMADVILDFVFLREIKAVSAVTPQKKPQGKNSRKKAYAAAKSADGPKYSLINYSCENVGRRIAKPDIAICAVICLGYGILAFANLGAHTTANTSWEPEAGDYITLLAEDDISKITYLPGIGVSDNGNYYKVDWSFDVDVSSDGESWLNLCSETDDSGSVYEWCYASAQSEEIGDSRYIRITATAGDDVINEIGLISADGESIVPYTIVDYSTADPGKINDEQDSVPVRSYYYNSTYFDEIYHARTAYELILGVEAYENTHPPLGKLIIALGILIFGMNPFGWRFMGTLFGVLMLPVLYHLLKRLFGSTWISAIGTLVFTFDFMHYVQTRIATIDTYAVFFLLLMFDAMLVFFQKDIMKSKLKDLVIPLAFSGVFMGLGVAAKWTCAYAGVGLGIMYFFKLFASRPADASVRRAYLVRCIDLCLWCMLWFIAVPFGIYFCAFLPLTTQPQNSYDIFGRFCAYQTHMFNYHSQLVAEHYFSSPWYEWPLDIRNIWYAADAEAYGEGTYSSITCMGNPLVWWTGLACMAAAVPAYVVKRRDWSAVAIIGYAAVMVPWMLVSRLTFVYHYFTAVPFLIIAICGSMHLMGGSARLSSPLGTSGILARVNPLKIISAVYLAAVVIMFVIYYPVLSGASTTTEYIKSLEFMPNWYFG